MSYFDSGSTQTMSGVQAAQLSHPPYPKPRPRARAQAVHDAQAGQRHGHRVLDVHRLARAAELHPRAVVGRAPRPVHGRYPAVVVRQPAPARVLRLRLRRQSVFLTAGITPPPKALPVLNT